MSTDASGLVPLIDISGFSSTDPAAQAEVARQVRAACERIGFFLIAGHGVPEAMIAETQAASHRFFALPLEEKLEIKRLQQGVSRGYNRLADQSLSYSRGVAAPPDLQESINFGPIDVPDEPYYTEGHAPTHFAPNRYPARPENLGPLVKDYYRALEQLASRLMRIFAMALDLEPGFFDDKIDRHISSLRLAFYPDQGDAPEAGQLRAGAHTDYGSLTILRIEDAPGGLQVQDRDGRWVDVPAIPGSFVVNIGDLMQQWTNDRWVSTLHRVVNPPRDRALGSRRLSLVFFHQPNHDAMVECIPSCASTAEPPRYAPTTSGAHWRTKTGAARAMRLAAAAT